MGRGTTSTKLWISENPSRDLLENFHAEDVARSLEGKLLVEVEGVIPWHALESSPRMIVVVTPTASVNEHCKHTLPQRVNINEV